jgi:predicted alpha/beta-fold hydrolase
MDSAERKAYNKKYYETNKEKIYSQIFEKVECSLCGKVLCHQNMKKHQKTKQCSKKSVVNNPTDLTMQLKRMKEQLCEMEKQLVLQNNEVVIPIESDIIVNNECILL